MIKFADHQTSFPTQPAILFLGGPCAGSTLAKDAAVIAKSQNRVVEIIEPPPVNHPCCNSQGALHKIKCPIYGATSLWP